MAHSRPRKNPALRLDIAFIQESLDTAYQYLQSTKDQDLVLVIGNTGVGKSTTCNYLVGHPLHKTSIRGYSVIDTVQETNIKIGHRIGCETLFAKGFLAKDLYSQRDVCLVDCPGFLGTKSIEECVVESLSTEIAIRSGRQVKCLLVLFTYLSVEESRMLEMRKLIQILIALLRDPIEMVQHSIFVVTKGNYTPVGETLSTSLARLAELKSYAQEQAEALRLNPRFTSSEGLSCADYDKIAGYFSAVLENPEHVVVINPLDKGESRRLIFERINRLKPRKGYLKKIGSVVKKAIGYESEQESVRPITYDDFNFSDYNEHRITFNKAIYFRVREGTTLIEKIKKSSEKFLNLHAEITSSQNRVSLLHDLKSNLENEINKSPEQQQQSVNVNYESVRNLQKMLEDISEEILSAENAVEEVRRKKVDLQEELALLDTDEPIPYISKSVFREFPWWKFLGWEEMKFEARTDDEVPIIDVKKDMRNGKWINEEDLCRTGYYGITYQSEFGAEPASAFVKTFIKKKDEAGNKIKIQSIRAELSELEEFESIQEAKIKLLKQNADALRTSLAQSENDEEGYKKSLQNKLLECEKDVLRYEQDILKMQKDKKNSIDLGLKSLVEFAENRQKMDLIVSISKLLEFPSSLVKRFVSEYMEFLENLAFYASSFDEEFAKSSASSPAASEKSTSDKVFILKDPITGNPIKDLVLTPCGTAFDAISLLKQFDTSSGNPQPFQFEREDGAVEVIEYLKWNKISDVQKYMDDQRSERLSQSSPTEGPSFMSAELGEEDRIRLDEQRKKLQQEIEVMKVELEAKETDLERISQLLG